MLRASQTLRTGHAVPAPPPFSSQVETEAQRGAVVYLKTQSGDSQISGLSANLPFPTRHHPNAHDGLHPHLHTLDTGIRGQTPQQPPLAQPWEPIREGAYLHL